MRSVSHEGRAGHVGTPSCLQDAEQPRNLPDRLREIDSSKAGNESLPGADRVALPRRGPLLSGKRRMAHGSDASGAGLFGLGLRKVREQPQHRVGHGVTSPNTGTREQSSSSARASCARARLRRCRSASGEIPHTAAASE